MRERRWWLVPLVLAVGTAASDTYASAQAEPAVAPPVPVETPQEPKEPHFGGQRKFGVSLDAGTQTGFGAGLSLGGSTGLRLTAGWLPVLISFNTGDLEAYSSTQFTADLYTFPIHASERADAGFTLGYRYNSLLGHGAGGGFSARVDLSKSVALQLLFGLTVFPDGEDRLRDEKRLGGVDFQFPGPSINGGASIALVFFP